MSYRDKSNDIERREIIHEVGRFIAYEFKRDPDVVEYAALKLADHRAAAFWDRLARRPVWRCACAFVPEAQVKILEAKYQPGLAYVPEEE